MAQYRRRRDSERTGTGTAALVAATRCGWSPVIEWRCAVCGAVVSNREPFPWRCPNATVDDPHHVLHLPTPSTPPTPPTSTTTPAATATAATTAADPPAGEDPVVSSLGRYGDRLAWWDFAIGNGLSEEVCRRLTDELAEGFAITPFGRSAQLSDRLGTNIWVKDETGNVAGSHKGRHLVGILLRLRAAEELGLLPERPPLAIASCGNAALAAATLAQRVGWPIDVYVPTWMDAAFGARLDALGAHIHPCERRPADPPGDPAMLRFREARAAGSIPFTVQGPENASCLDGGRTLGWEITDQAAAAGIRPTRAFAQVGGGAFAACLGAGLGRRVRLDTVQAEGCAPLAEAWQRSIGVAQPAHAWSQLMTPWPNPTSVADGILDDETYDWLADFAVMADSGGRPIVASERDIVRAHDLATDAGFDVSPTGSAGLAGVLTVRAELAPSDDVVIVMTGVGR